MAMKKAMKAPPPMKALKAMKAMKKASKKRVRDSGMLAGLHNCRNQRVQAHFLEGRFCVRSRTRLQVAQVESQAALLEDCQGQMAVRLALTTQRVRKSRLDNARAHVWKHQLISSRVGDSKSDCSLDDDDLSMMAFGDASASIVYYSVMQ